MNAGHLSDTRDRRGGHRSARAALSGARDLRSRARAALRETPTRRAVYDGLSWLVYSAAIVAAAAALAWLVSGCATSGATTGRILSPEACSVAAVECGAARWPACGEVEATVDYALCQLQGAAACYLQLTGPGGACQRVAP